MTTEKANTDAKNTRHQRVFLSSGFSAYVSKCLPTFKLFIGNIRSLFRRRKTKHLIAGEEVYVRDPFGKFLKQAFAVSAALLIVTSFAPSQLLETGFTADYFDADTDFVDENDELTAPVFIMNDEGFVLKPSPVSEDVNRIGLTDVVQHTVVPGDTLSGIASLYGISLNTLLWENNISEDATLRVSQILTIPAVDGISHVVASETETLSGIAKLYSVDMERIKEHNNIEGDTITKGQRLFIPGGKRREPPAPPRQTIAARSGSRSSGRVSFNSYDRKTVMASDDTPDEGKKLIYPTVGNLTQGFRGGHLAYDIANPSKPDVWAAAGGTIVKASGGCHPREVHVDRGCGGGYGNYVVIDHGDGLQTLYSHLETIYVSEGDAIAQGQAIGKMGSSGRTYGKTGIHLHFEVFDNGVKKNPGRYF